MLCLIVGLRIELFFAAFGVLGFNYEGAEQSGSYIAFIAITSALIYAVAAHFLMARRVATIGQLVTIALPLIFIVIYLLDDALGRTQASSERHFVLALALVCPAAVAGMLCAQEGARERLAYAVEPLMLIFTLAVTLSALGTLQAVSMDRGVGGATYQTASYLGASAFNLNLHYLLFGRTGTRPLYSRTRAYGVISVLLLPVQVMTVLLSGGRGGFVLVAVGGLIQLVLAHRTFGGKTFGRVLLAVLALLPLGIWGVPRLVSSPVVGPIVNRVFAWMGDGGIDWSGTSGRDRVYGEAMGAIEIAPPFGYGLFSWGLDYYPHNMVLELLLNGGIFYATAWALLLTALAFRVVRLLISDPPAGAILPLALYPLIMLQFSGTYMTSGPLWFFLSFMLCVEVKTGSQMVPPTRRRR